MEGNRSKRKNPQDGPVSPEAAAKRAHVAEYGDEYPGANNERFFAETSDHRLPLPASTLVNQEPENYDVHETDETHIASPIQPPPNTGGGATSLQPGFFQPSGQSHAYSVGGQPVHGHNSSVVAQGSTLGQHGLSGGWSSAYPFYRGRFTNSHQARSFRQAKAQHQPYKDPAEDSTIAQFKINRAEHVRRLYHAMVRNDLARDNRGSLAVKRWVTSKHYNSDLIEAYCHRILDCLIEQVENGFRGWQNDDFVMGADKRKYQAGDEHANCAERFENIVTGLELEKTVCEDMMGSKHHVRMFVNAPLAYTQRKVDNRSGNNRRARPRNDQAASAQQNVAPTRRGRGNTDVSTRGAELRPTPQSPNTTEYGSPRNYHRASGAVAQGTTAETRGVQGSATTYPPGNEGGLYPVPIAPRLRDSERYRYQQQDEGFGNRSTGEAVLSSHYHGGYAGVRGRGFLQGSQASWMADSAYLVEPSFHVTNPGRLEDEAEQNYAQSNVNTHSGLMHSSFGQSGARIRTPAEPHLLQQSARALNAVYDQGYEYRSALYGASTRGRQTPDQSYGDQENGSRDPLN